MNDPYARFDLARANVLDLVLAQAELTPGAPAFTSGTRTLGYGDLAQLVARLRFALAARGVARQDHVACKVGKSPESLALFLAVLAEGAVYVPVNPGFGNRETEEILADAQPGLLILDQSENTVSGCPTAGLFSDRSGVALLDGMSASTAAPAPGGAEVCAAMLYTSGTTGRPKGARISHCNLSSSFTRINGMWGITAQDRLLHVLPTFHAHGLLMATLCPLIAGAEIVMTERFDIHETLRLLPHVTSIMAVPTIYSRLLERPEFNDQTCRNLRLATCGSAPLSPELFDTVQQRTGLALVERYGSTEAGMISANPVGGAKRGSAGKAIPGVDLRLVDKEGHAIQQGEVGRVQARGPHVFMGYWNRPELAGLSFTADGFFDTGDFGRLDEEGYLYIIGRDKDMIITGGYNVYPREVEVALEEIDGVREAVVFGAPHPDFGEGVVAAVKCEPGAVLDTETIMRALSDRLVGYKRPKRIVLADGFPRNELGKIRRSELAAQHATIFVVAAATD